MKKLNIKIINDTMEAMGFSASAVAKELSVSRESASKWLKGSTFPRPDKLLKLSLLLNLNYDNLVITEDENRPIIAFRKRAGTKTKNNHINRAIEMGYMLKPLVEYLPFDKYIKPKTLKTPSTDYNYLQELSKIIRKDIGLKSTSNIDFRHLVKLFSDKQTVLIPVLWGKKEKHENALHIFLPDSMTTWVYLNLDVEVHDFKFWMTHELGHILSPNLRGDKAEDFADAFAGALLFPKDLARKSYHKVMNVKFNTGAQINVIKEIAEEHLISPITVYYEINNYANYKKLPKITINNIFASAKNLSKQYYTVSESLFDSKHPKAKKYIKFSDDTLESPFFNSLKNYLLDNDKGYGYIQSILDIPLMDARKISSVLR